MPKSIQDRLTAAVAKRLGVTVAFLRWDRDTQTGADIPVFAVPASVIANARALGLTAEAA